MKMLNRLLGTLIEYGDYMELDALNLDQGYFWTINFYLLLPQFH